MKFAGANSDFLLILQLGVGLLISYIVFLGQISAGMMTGLTKNFLYFVVVLTPVAILFTIAVYDYTNQPVDTLAISSIIALIYSYLFYNKLTEISKPNNTQSGAGRKR
jgi:hypothetical protein